jgi:membrane protein
MASLKLNGAGSAVKEIVDRVRSIVRLEVELALLEIKAKITKIAVGIGLGAGAAVAAVFAFAFLLAGAAAGLATVIPVWAALLVVAGVLLLTAALLGYLSVRSIKAGTPPMPEEAIAEARLTTETVLQNGR